MLPDRMTTFSDAYVFIMAGGSGERFWPMSRRKTPKHLLRLFSDVTLVEETVRRVSGLVPPENIFILTNEAQLEGTRAAVKSVPPAQVLAEPAKRDTGPAATLATALVHSRNPKGVLALLPADALIEDHATFRRQLGEAIERADETALLTVAIKPAYPATGFGYLEMDEQLPLGSGGSTFRRVGRFVEKPDLATATDYVASGHFAWNAGMFVWRAGAFLAETEKHVPEYAEFIRTFPKGKDAAGFIAEKFPHLPKISVDYAIMERASRVIAIKAEFDWDDVGTWTALPAHLSQDALGNTLRGKVAQIESHNNIAISNGRLIALCGVKDLVVVETPDAILVCHKDVVQDVKKLQPQLPDDVL